MMTEDDKVRAAGELVASVEVIGQSITPNAAVMMVDDLAEQYGIDQVLSALRRCRQEVRGRLTLADIRDRVPGSHPTPDEAWAIALQSSDETDTVVWTDEIARAMSVAKPMLDMRDRVGARMSFLDTYRRLVRESTDARRPVTWSLSLGSDPVRREAAVIQARELGRLSNAQADSYLLLASPGQPITQDGLAIVGLLAAPESAPPASSETVAKELAKIRALLDQPTAEEQARIDHRANCAQAVKTIDQQLSKTTNDRG